jgi:hypothetical protein
MSQQVLILRLEQQGIALGVDARELPQQADRPVDFSAGLTNWLSLFKDKCARESQRVGIENVGHATQQRAAFTQRTSAPALLGNEGARHSPFDHVHICNGSMAHHLLCRRVENRCIPGTSHKPAIDKAVEAPDICDLV